jgi:hypothetical protein
MTTGVPQHVTIMPASINVPHPYLYVSMSVMSNGSPEGDAAVEPVLQELIDLLQTWPGRLADVTGQLYSATLAPVSPADPDPLPDPPDPEPGEVAPEVPAEV